MHLLENFLAYLSSFRNPKTIKQKRINLKAVEEFFKEGTEKGKNLKKCFS